MQTEIILNLRHLQVFYVYFIVPKAPLSLTADPGINSCSFSFTIDDSDKNDNFHCGLLLSNGIESHVLPKNSNTFNFTKLEAVTLYEFSLCIKYKEGCGVNLTQICNTKIGVPEDITVFNIVSGSTTNTSFTVEWREPKTNGNPILE